MRTDNLAQKTRGWNYWHVLRRRNRTSVVHTAHTIIKGHSKGFASAMWFWQNSETTHCSQSGFVRDALMYASTAARNSTAAPALTCKAM
jgi:hypothetical protein